MAAGSTLKATQITLSTARSPPVSAMTKETTSTRHTGASKRVDGTGRSWEADPKLQKRQMDPALTRARPV